MNTNRNRRAISEMMDKSVEMGMRNALTSPEGRAFIAWWLDLMAYNKPITDTELIGMHSMSIQVATALGYVDTAGFMTLLRDYYIGGEEENERSSGDGNDRDSSSDGVE